MLIALCSGSSSGVGVGTCNAIREAVIVTPQTSFPRSLFYNPPLDGVFARRAVTARLITLGRRVRKSIAAWQQNDILGHRRDQLWAIIESTLDAEAAHDWQSFSAPLPDGMLLSELRDYLWVDNAQQRERILFPAVATRLGVDAEEVPPALDRVRVMTMHGAKGLSARVVFIPGFKHGLLPNQHQTPVSRAALGGRAFPQRPIYAGRVPCAFFRSHNGGPFEGIFRLEPRRSSPHTLAVRSKEESRP